MRPIKDTSFLYVNAGIVCWITYFLMVITLGGALAITLGNNIFTHDMPAYYMFMSAMIMFRVYILLKDRFWNWNGDLSEGARIAWKYTVYGSTIYITATTPLWYLGLTRPFIRVVTIFIGAAIFVIFYSYSKRKIRSIEAANSVVKECMDEIDFAEVELNENTPFIPPELITEARRLLSDVEKTTHTVRVDGVSPRNVAWLVISNVSGNMLASGQHHVYRGVLSMTGTALKQTFLLAVKRLQQNGYHDEDRAKEDVHWLNERIEEAG